MIPVSFASLSARRSSAAWARARAFASRTSASATARAATSGSRMPLRRPCISATISFRRSRTSSCALRSFS
jgi:hypothetical protein